MVDQAAHDPGITVIALVRVNLRAKPRGVIAVSEHLPYPVLVDDVHVAPGAFRDIAAVERFRHEDEIPFRLARLVDDIFPCLRRDALRVIAAETTQRTAGFFYPVLTEVREILDHPFHVRALLADIPVVVAVGLRIVERIVGAPEQVGDIRPLAEINAFGGRRPDFVGVPRGKPIVEVILIIPVFITRQPCGDIARIPLRQDVLDLGGGI